MTTALHERYGLRQLMILMAMAVMLPLSSCNPARIVLGADHPQFGREIESIDERIEIVEMLGLQMRANFELIETWTGSYNFIDRSFFKGTPPVPPEVNRQNAGWLNDNEAPSWGPADFAQIDNSSKDGFWRVTKGSFEFSVDTAHGRSHVFMNCFSPVAYVNGVTGHIAWNKNAPWHTHWINTTEAGLEFDTHEMFHQLSEFPPIPTLPKAGSRVAFRRMPTKTRAKSHTFDPRDLFTNGMYTPGKKNLFSELCIQRVDFLKKKLPLTSQFYVSPESPPVYTEYIHGRDGAETITRYDGKVGFNVVDKTDLRDGKIAIQRLVTFRNSSGIYIPEKATWILATGPKTERWFVRDLTLTQSTLNQPISDSAFNTEKLDFQYGDRLVDEIKSRLFVRNSKEFVAAEGFVYNSPQIDSNQVTVKDKAKRVNQADPPIPQTGSRMLLMINGTVILCVLGFYLYRRFAVHDK